MPDRDPRDIPVVFIVFNRPDMTAKVLASIRALAPRRLFVVMDGPRSHVVGETERCAAVRALVDSQVDWDCNLKMNRAETNLGCKERVHTGISWAFEQVDEAIILEDDCLPDSSFFTFCNEMLTRYRDVPRVGHIAGTNPCLEANPQGDASYFYSRHVPIWGWATWRRAWQDYDVSMRAWPQFRDSGTYANLGLLPRFAKNMAGHFDTTWSGEAKTWDFAWTFTNYSCDRLGVIPSRNLIANIGFGVDATHTLDPEDPLANLPTSSLPPPYQAPMEIAPYHPWDRAFEARFSRTLWQRITGKVRRLLRGTPARSG